MRLAKFLISPKNSLFDFKLVVFQLKGAAEPPPFSVTKTWTRPCPACIPFHWGSKNEAFAM